MSVGDARKSHLGGSGDKKYNEHANFFLKKWPIAGSFSFIFVLFLSQQQLQ